MTWVNKNINFMVKKQIYNNRINNLIKIYMYNFEYHKNLFIIKKINIFSIEYFKIKNENI